MFDNMYTETTEQQQQERKDSSKPVANFTHQVRSRCEGVIDSSIRGTPSSNSATDVHKTRRWVTK
eukprot:6484074-Amphidinium_carterae.1